MSEENARYVLRHGKRIEVVTVNTDALLSPRRRQMHGKPDKLFARSYRKHTALLRSAKVAAAVWNVYAELSWRDYKAGKPFKFSNYALDDLGISHDSKTRALYKLKELGIIRIEQQQLTTCPIVTLIGA
jgi:hypothetical protein